MRQWPSAARASLGVGYNAATAKPAFREPAPLVCRVRALTPAKGDSMGLVVRRWRQCSAGKS